MEERVIILERLFEQHEPDCYSNNNTHLLVTIRELKTEIFRLEPLQKEVDINKTNKDGLCHFLRRIRHTKRNDGTFTMAQDLIPDQEIQMPHSSDNKKNENDDAYSMVDKKYRREVIGENYHENHSIVHHAMHATSEGQSRFETDTAILDIVFSKVRTMRKSLQQRGRETITSRVIIGRNEPVTSPIGANQSQMFSPIGGSDQNAALNLCETQSLAPTDHEAAAILGSLSHESPDLSASQQIHNGVLAFQVDNETPIRKTHSEVKDVSRDYLYWYRCFVQCLWVVLLRCINVIIFFCDCN